MGQFALKIVDQTEFGAEAQYFADVNFQTCACVEHIVFDFNAAEVVCLLAAAEQQIGLHAVAGFKMVERIQSVSFQIDILAAQGWLGAACNIANFKSPGRGGFVTEIDEAEERIIEWEILVQHVVFDTGCDGKTAALFRCGVWSNTYSCGANCDANGT